MPIELTSPQIQQAIILLAALATFATILAVAWPWIARDRLAERIRLIEQGQRQSPRSKRSRSGAQVAGRSHLFAKKPNRLFVGIVERLSLERLADESGAAQLLGMAGLRGRAPLVTFLASRLIAAVAMPGIAFGYIALVVQPDLPLPIIAAMASVGAVIGYWLPTLYVRNLISKRQGSLRRSWPDALDLLLICVESGMSSEAAFRKVAEEIGAQSRELAEEMSLTTAELAFLSDRRQAYENLGTRTGLDSIKATIIGLIQSEKYGTSLGQTLRVLAKESRDFRMAAAEKKAASLPPKLTVPMILFFLPVLFAVIATPAIIQAIGAP
ncbi:type II secretion system F family protein [Maritimibacter sp. HL-12]|jgi:tight adherence protein C|uniref:type II secretion system F family protein n=1 Tax=Maritimibacter sp. HL-12 TaxID=1162418 RepID=UPI000A0F3E80|nr:type II secretion system F family protein [Maritimibacter sp. HL-12]SMH37788.1 tight adherence protein C [Maritimibacter sp. HL-12]